MYPALFTTPMFVDALACSMNTPSVAPRIDAEDALLMLPPLTR